MADTAADANLDSGRGALSETGCASALARGPQAFFFISAWRL